MRTALWHIILPIHRHFTTIRCNSSPKMVKKREFWWFFDENNHIVCLYMAPSGLRASTNVGYTHWVVLLKFGANRLHTTEFFMQKHEFRLKSRFGGFPWKWPLLQTACTAKTHSLAMHNIVAPSYNPLTGISQRNCRSLVQKWSKNVFFHEISTKMCMMSARMPPRPC